MAEDYIENEKILKIAWGKALNFLSYRARSIREMEIYLSQKNFDDTVIKEVIPKLIKFDLLDDRQFAKEWLEYSVRRGRGSLRIKYELEEKGVDKEIIKEVLEENINFNSEYQTSYSVVEKYLPYQYDRNDLHLKRKTAQYLKRRGFPGDIINIVLKNYFI